MDAKKQLARRLVERYHGAEAGHAALEDFNTRFSKRDLEHADLPQVSLAGVGADVISIVVAGFELGFQKKRSRSDARRLVEQGSVQLHGEKITDPKATPAIKTGDVVRLDKTHAVRVAL
jgi:tyrosyl-tRNA synthetase